MYNFDEEIRGWIYAKEIAGKVLYVSRVSEKECLYQGSEKPIKVKILLKKSDIFLSFLDGENFIVSSPICDIRKSRNGNFVIFTKNKEIYFLGDKVIA